MHKSLKVPLVLVISIIILLVVVYTIGYVKLKSEYKEIYSSCLQNIPETRQAIENNPSRYPTAQECTDNGGCYITCGKCGKEYKSSSYTFEDAFFSLIPLRECSAIVCMPVCLDP